MYSLSYNNHFKFGYNNQWFRFRESPDDQWTVSYGACERSVSNFREECYATARLIRDSTNDPLTVLFSGGSDSEIVVRAFADQKIPINVAICQFSDNLNIFDTSFAVVCCEQLGIPYKVIQLDINKFLDGEYLNYAEPTQCRSPELCSTMWLADQVDGMPILGSGECYVVKRVPPTYVDGESPYEHTPWDMHEKELIAAWYRHFMVQGRQAVPGFFQYNPEIMLSFLLDDRVVDLVNNHIIGKRSTMTSKLGIYQKYFPLSDRKKYSGYEKINSRVVDIRAQLHQRWPQSDIYMTEYNDLVAMLRGKIEGPKGIQQSKIDRIEFAKPLLTEVNKTRQLTIEDYDQAMELIEERFSTVIEFQRAEKRDLVKLDDSFDAFRETSLIRWRLLMENNYLQGITHKLFGSFSNGKLMSMVGMRLVFDNAWVLSNLKARDVPLSKTGLKQTMAMLYQHAKDIGRTEYYCCVAEYRYHKFQKMMQKLVPEYYNEYEDEILTIVPAGTQPENDFWWGMMGRNIPDVNVIIKRMRLKNG